MRAREDLPSPDCVRPLAERGTGKTVAGLLVAVLVMSGCTGGVDGPVVEGNRRSGGEDAGVSGEVTIEGECVYLLQSEIDTRYPVIWPHGTQWDSDQSAVVLPDGTRVTEGDEVSGSGGYHDRDSLSEYTTSDGVASVSSCVDNEYGEVAVLNSSGKIDIRG
jgi:hypothetical protein